MNQILYIHAGFPKTGSTTIQDFLYKNRESLRIHGIYYPDPHNISALPGHTGHLSMVEADAKFRFDPTPWHVYRKKIYDSLIMAKCPVNILSAEAFIYEKVGHIDFWKEDFEVKLICYIRNFFDYRISLEKQIIKEGLRQDAFCYNFSASAILAQVDNYVKSLGKDSCYFLNYDKIVREGSILKAFFNIIDPTYEENFFIKRSNVTASDAAIKFLCQLQFLPFGPNEWKIIRSEILKMDLAKWNEYRCSFLPQLFFTLDDSCKKAIKRQGELLNDPNWYDYTLTRGNELANIGNSDLPPEIQHDIWGKLSGKAQSVILRYWPKAGKAIQYEPILPRLNGIASDVFEQMTVLRRAYVVSIGNYNRLFRQKQDSEASRIALERDVRASQQSSERRRDLIVRAGVTGKSLPNICDILAPFFFVSARQIYAIRRSGLFDIGWYLEQNADVAESGLDPILHYVRYGAVEGRDPAPWFSTSAYVQANPDVASSSINPLYHYIRFGIAEGRETFDAR